MGSYKKFVCVGAVAEVVTFLFKLCEGLNKPTVKLFIYSTACSSTYKDNFTCAHLSEYPEEESYVQHLSVKFLMLYKFIVCVPIIAYGLCCGAWSDRIGRKIPIVLACLGNVLAGVFYVLATFPIFPSMPFVLTGVTTHALFGKGAVLTMAVNSYISDISSEESRTKRVGSILAMRYFGTFAGQMLAGLSLDFFSFRVSFCCVIAIYLLALFLILFLLVESVPKKSEDSKVANANPFNLRNIRESLDVLLKVIPIFFTH